MSWEDPDITMTAFEPSLAELESEFSLNVSLDMPVVGQEVHILDDDDDEEGWVDAPVEPQLSVDTHPLLALEGLLLPPSSPVPVAPPTQEHSDSDLVIFANAVESMKLVFKNTVDWQREWLSNISKGIPIDKALKMCTTLITNVVEKASNHLLAEVRDFGSKCINAIQWNAQQTQSEFQESLITDRQNLMTSITSAVTENKDVQLLVTEVHTLRQQMGSVQATLESLVRQQCALNSQVNSIHKREEWVLKEAVTPVAVSSQAHTYPVSPVVKNVVLLPTSAPVGVPSDCSGAAAPKGEIFQDDGCRVTDGKLPIKMFFPCYGGPQDEKDPLVYLQRCSDFLSLKPLTHGEILATMRSVLHGSARDWWETVREKIHSWEEFQRAFLSSFLPEDYVDVLEEQIRTRVQGRNESLRDFVFFFQALIKRWHSSATDDEILKRILKAMNPFLACQLRGRVTSIDEMIRIGSQIEVDYENQKRYRRTLNESHKANGTTEKKVIKRPEMVLCWRCHGEHAPGFCPQFHVFPGSLKYSGQQKSESKQTSESSKKGSMATVASQPAAKNRQKQKSTSVVGSPSHPPTSLKQLVVPITVRQRHGKALVDTGATYTLLHVSLWNKIKGPNESLVSWQGGPMYLANGQQANPIGCKVLEFSMHGNSWFVPTAVLDADVLVYPLVLGLDFMSMSGLQVNVRDKVYSFAGDDTTRVFPFQPVLCPSDGWGVLSVSSVALYTTLPPTLPLLPAVSDDWCNLACIPKGDDLPSLLHTAVADSGLTGREAEKLYQLLLNNPRVCTTTLGRTSVLKHKIKLNSDVVVTQRPYRLPLQKRKMVKEQIEEMLQQGIIVPSHSPWASPIVVVPRKDGGTPRFCVDLRRVNERSEGDAYPLPTISEILESLAGSAVFTTLDLNSGYWQVEMDPESQHLTAFVTCFGLFHFRVMPFGLKGAPATFQRLMTQVLRSCLGECCMVYLDDIIIYSKDVQNHFHDVQRVFDCLQQAGLTLNIKKCHFCCPELKFLGHVVSKEGVQADPAKTEALCDYPVPRNLKEVQRFLGLAGWYHRYVPNFSMIAEPLNALKKKGVVFKWSEECQKAFQCLKDHLTSPPVLGHPDMCNTFVVYTDASSTGLGAVLAQRSNTSSREEVIAYGSRSLARSEQNYSTTERECLAVVWSLEKWRHYLEGKPFVVVTDHSSLLWVFNTNKASSRLIRWALRLQEFSFTIEYRKGKLNNAPDALSRATGPASLALYTRSLTRDEKFVPFPLTDEDVWKAQRSDPDIQKIYQALLTDDKPGGEADSGFVILEDTVYRKTKHLDRGDLYQVYVPQSLRPVVLHAYHDNPLSGHFGRYKTQQRIREVAYWPKIWTDVAEYVRSCTICQKYKPESRKPAGLLQQTKVTEPWEMLGLDLMGPLPRSSLGNTQLLVVVDYYSRWVELFPLRNATASTISKCLRKDIFTRWGVPKHVLSDRGPQFTSEVFKELCDSWGVVHKLTTAYHPQTNMTERINRSLKSMIASYVGEKHKSWDRFIPELRFALNSAVNEATGFSPAELLLRGSLKGPFARAFEPSSQVPRALKNVQALVESNLAQAKRKQAHTYNKNRRHVTYEMKDRVWMKAHPVSKASKNYTAKLAPRWIGPYRIVEQVGPVNYRIVREDTGKDLRVVNVCDLKECRPTSVEVEAQEREAVMRIFLDSDTSDEDEFMGFL